MHPFGEVHALPLLLAHHPVGERDLPRVEISLLTRMSTDLPLVIRAGLPASVTHRSSRQMEPLRQVVICLPSFSVQAGLTSSTEPMSLEIR